MKKAIYNALYFDNGAIKSSNIRIRGEKPLFEK